MEVIDPEFVQFDDQNQTIFLTKEGMSLDLGGIAKGYIADRIKNLWQAYGVESGIINLGGNLLLMGDAPHHNDKKNGVLACEIRLKRIKRMFYKF